VGIRARIGWGSCALALAAVLALAGSPARAQGADAKPADAAEAAAAAAAHEAALPTATAVLPVATSPGYESLGAGLRTWLAERLAAAGVEVLPLAKLDADLKGLGAPIRVGADTTKLARKGGAATALFAAIWVDGADAELRMHAH
jgi:hypothetical protein